MSIDFRAFCAALARLVDIDRREDDSAGRLLSEMLAALAGYDHCVIFAYRGDARPIDLFSTFDPQQYHVFVRLYQEGPFLLDPFYRAATQPRPGMWRMRELAPDRFFASEYYRSYYVETQLAEEIGYFTPVDEEATVVLSLMRDQSSGPFRPSEYDLLRKAEPLVSALVRSVWRDVARCFDAKENARAESAPPRPWTNQNLTVREKAIIDMVLQGHSSESIGLSLGIATGTVKVHRRNIYRKLGIASQTQLMSQYLESLKPSPPAGR